jgi:hypothetical protein
MSMGLSPLRGFAPRLAFSFPLTGFSAMARRKNGVKWAIPEGQTSRDTAPE